MLLVFVQKHYIPFWDESNNLVRFPETYNRNPTTVPLKGNYVPQLNINGEALHEENSFKKLTLFSNPIPLIQDSGTLSIRCAFLFTNNGS